MNTTTTNLPSSDNQINEPLKKVFLACGSTEKKRTMKSVSLRPSRSVKRNNSFKIHPLKTK